MNNINDKKNYYAYGSTKLYTVYELDSNGKSTGKVLEHHYLSLTQFDKSPPRLQECIEYKTYKADGTSDSTRVYKEIDRLAYYELMDLLDLFRELDKANLSSPKLISGGK